MQLFFSSPVYWPSHNGNMKLHYAVCFFFHILSRNQKKLQRICFRSKMGGWERCLYVIRNGKKLHWVNSRTRPTKITNCVLHRKHILWETERQAIDNMCKKILESNGITGEKWVYSNDKQEFKSNSVAKRVEMSVRL